jgi:hypothetical protein
MGAKPQDHVFSGLTQRSIAQLLGNFAHF